MVWLTSSTVSFEVSNMSATGTITTAVAGAPEPAASPTGRESMTIMKLMMTVLFINPSWNMNR